MLRFLVAGRSVAWLARVVRVHEVVSSNLTAPTIFFGWLQQQDAVGKIPRFIIELLFAPVWSQLGSNTHFEQGRGKTLIVPAHEVSNSRETP